MKKVVIYTGPMCPYCDWAIALLKKSNISFKEIDISEDIKKMEEMLNRSNGRKTIPQIFFDGYHVGGYEELRTLEKEEKLNNLLK